MVHDVSAREDVLLEILAVLISVRSLESQHPLLQPQLTVRWRLRLAIEERLRGKLRVFNRGRYPLFRA